MLEKSFFEWTMTFGDALNVLFAFFGVLVAVLLSRIGTKAMQHANNENVEKSIDEIKKEPIIDYTKEINEENQTDNTGFSQLTELFNKIKSEVPKADLERVGVASGGNYEVAKIVIQHAKDFGFNLQRLTPKTVITDSTRKYGDREYKFAKGLESVIRVVDQNPNVFSLLILP